MTYACALAFVYAYVPARVFPCVFLQTVTVKQMPAIHLCMLLGNKLLDSLKVRNIALCVCYLYTLCVKGFGAVFQNGR